MRRNLLALPLLIAALAFSACGDEPSEETAATAAPTEEATEAPTEAPTEAGPAGEVKVTGKVGEKPEIEVPGGAAPTELVIKDLKEGDGKEATAGSTIDVDYLGVLYKDGSPFDNSFDRGEPISFPLGQGAVIPGWDQGFEGMKEGGRRVITIPPDLAYGPAGSPPAIGPDETLVFVVDLKKVTEP